MERRYSQACDLLVLGGGPAGTAAAIQASRAGLDVVLLEAGVEPRAMPGETLHPGVEPILETLGVRAAVVAAGFHRHEGVWTEWDGPRCFLAYGADREGIWRGFQVDRARFGAVLLEAAVAAGVRLVRPIAPSKVLCEAGRVAGVIAGGCAFHAHLTFDATGRRSWLANVLRLRPEQRSPPWRLRFGWCSDAERNAMRDPLFSACPGGWNWEAPLGSGRVAWVKLRAPGEALQSIGSATGFAWRLHGASAGPGYFLLGDAAQTLDPASSHGVLRALMTGILAAHLLASCRQQRLSEAAAQEAYRDWVREQFERDAAALAELYARHPSGHLDVDLRREYGGA